MPDEQQTGQGGTANEGGGTSEGGGGGGTTAPRVPKSPPIDLETLVDAFIPDTTTKGNDGLGFTRPIRNPSRRKA